MHLINYILKGIKKKKIKYFACIFGFSVAISSIFVLTSFSINLDQSINQLYLTNQNTILIIEKGTSLFQVIPYGSIVNKNLTEQFREIPGVSFSLPLIFKEFENSSNMKLIRDTVVGIPMNLLNFFIFDIQLKEGNLPQDLTSEIIISPDVRNGNLKINDSILIRNKTFHICGILNSYNLLFDHFIYMDFDTSQELYNMKDQCSAIFVNAQNDADIKKIETYINQLDTNIASYNANTIREFSGNLLMTIQVVEIVLSFFPLIISSFFILIILLFNVRERRKEFGMLKSIGMSNIKLLKLLFIEALITIILSYLLGVFIGFLLYGYAYFLINGLGSEMSFYEFLFTMISKIPIEVYFYVFLISLGTGIIVSFYPIISSIRSSIVDLYRKE